MTDRRPKRIACLAWGSLVWDPRDLPLRTPWHLEGPRLPIELCRVGDHHELATALCPGSGPVPTRWAELRCDDVAEARDKLRVREEVDPLRADGIGSVEGLQDGGAVRALPQPLFCSDKIADWGRRTGLDAVIWTALPPRMNGQEGRTPTADEAVAYLRGLTGQPLEHARKYIERLALEIRTPFRTRVEDELGWKQPAAAS